jgi:outer membrane protein insertion porin family
VSRGFDIYKRNTDLTTTAVTQYGTHTTGGGVRFGVPIAEEESINYGLSGENTKLILPTNPTTRLIDYVNTFGSSNTNLMGTVGWSRDTRDSAIYTTEGTVQNAFLELALPVFDMRYYKLNYQHQFFIR